MKPIALMTTPELLAEYNALTGKSIKKFSSRAAGEKQLAGARVLFGKETVVTPPPLPPVPEDLKDDAMLNKLEPGSLLHQIYISAHAKQPIEKLPKRVKDSPSTQRKRIEAVRIPEGAQVLSKLQPNSMRAKIMEFIRAQPDKSATVEMLELKFECPVRGFLQKLLEKNHLETVE